MPRVPLLLGFLFALIFLAGCGRVLRTPAGPHTPSRSLTADRANRIVRTASPHGLEKDCRAAAESMPAVEPGKSPETVRSAESFQSAASHLVASGAWIVRFRRNDHGAQRALEATYAAAAAPIWLADRHPTHEAFALLAMLEGAEAYGLEPQDYEVERLSALASEVLGASAEGACGTLQRARFDIALSAAALALVSDLHYGRIDPRAVGFDLGTPRPDDLDLKAQLRALASAEDVGRTLISIEPHFYHYRLLEQALGKYRLLEQDKPALAPRVRQIVLTLERWRWLPAFESPPIIVNIPEFRLFAFRTTADRAADILQMDVIVGRTFPRTQTPVFAADMTSVIGPRSRRSVGADRCEVLGNRTHLILRERLDDAVHDRGRPQGILDDEQLLQEILRVLACEAGKRSVALSVIAVARRAGRDRLLRNAALEDSPSLHNELWIV